jgi:hypothetical protein
VIKHGGEDSSQGSQSTLKGGRLFGCTFDLPGKFSFLVPLGLKLALAFSLDRGPFALRGFPLLTLTTSCLLAYWTLPRLRHATPKETTGHHHDRR